MTELLFQTDSYLKEFEAEVQRVDQEKHAVQLNRSAFFPGGGGQPFDNGSIIFDGAIYSVKRSKNTPEGLWHFIEGDSDLPSEGLTILGKINWERRYKIMRTHTAMHILCGVIFRDYKAQVTGGDMEPLKGRMDFEFETMTRELVSVIEKAVNEEVTDAHEVKVAILPREEAFQIPDLIRTKINLLPPAIKEVRTIEIVGLDLQADGGTHVHSTSEVGKMKVADYKSKGKINKRIYIELE